MTAADGSLSAMLGASPGASTAVWIMLELLQKCFGEKMSNGWSNRLREIIPSYGQSLIEDAALCKKVREETAEVLKIQQPH